MHFLSWEKIALNILAFLQNVGSWVCIGTGIILIMAGIIFVTQRTIHMTPAGTAGYLTGRRYRVSALRPVMCFAIGGVLAFGGWAFVTELSKNAYLQVLAIVIEEDPGYVNKVKNIHDVPLSEPSVDQVLTAFEDSGGVLADGFKQSIEKIPDIVGSMNKILVRAGFNPVDEKIVESAIESIQTSQASGEDSEDMTDSNAQIICTDSNELNTTEKGE